MNPRNHEPSFSGAISEAIKREQSVTADWTLLREPIDGVSIKEIRSVVKDNGYLTEIFRTDWGIDRSTVDQVFQLLLNPGAVEAWHVHEQTTDRFFVSVGRVRLVLYDARQESTTFGLINELRIGTERLTIVSVPPGVWHGVKNISAGPCVMLNLVDRAYQYEAPDHWGLPVHTDKIPYQF